MERQLEHRNFGLGSRYMANAAMNALKEAQYSFKTVATNTGHFRQFANFVRNEHGIKDLRDIEKQHVMAFAHQLKDRLTNGEISASTAQNRLSAVNVVMSIARQDSHCHVNPVREAGLASRTFVATESKTVSAVQHEQAKAQLPERLAVQLDLQRELGLRFKESALFNAQQSLKHAHNGMIKVENGTKGGRPREIPITNERQLSVLHAAATLQGKHHSLVPSTQSLREYTQDCYRSLQQTSLKGFHCERHTYANHRYEQLVGVKSPVEAHVSHGKAHISYIANQLCIEKEKAIELDREARLMISHELGHCRIAITNNYLG